MSYSKEQKNFVDILYVCLNISCGVSNPNEPDRFFPKGRFIILQKEVSKILDSFDKFCGRTSKSFKKKVDQIKNHLLEISPLLDKFKDSGEQDVDTLTDINAKFRASYTIILKCL